MYDASIDPYCYTGTTVWKNRAGVRRQDALNAFETAMVAQRTIQRLPSGRLDVTHYQAVHRHLFRDVYAWAGRFRTVHLAKSGSMFCYPEHIAREMRMLFETIDGRGLRAVARSDFIARLAAFLATLNAIHPFREGNGRTQIAFAAIVAADAGQPLALEKLQAVRFLAAMIASFHGDERPLQRALARMVVSA